LLSAHLSLDNVFDFELISFSLSPIKLSIEKLRADLRLEVKVSLGLLLQLPSSVEAVFECIDCEIGIVRGSEVRPFDRLMASDGIRDRLIG